MIDMSAFDQLVLRNLCELGLRGRPARLKPETHQRSAARRVLDGDGATV
jgi:hypothetical protein